MFQPRSCNHVDALQELFQESILLSGATDGLSASGVVSETAPLSAAGLSTAMACRPPVANPNLRQRIPHRSSLRITTDELSGHVAWQSMAGAPRAARPTIDCAVVPLNPAPVALRGGAGAGRIYSRQNRSSAGRKRKIPAGIDQRGPVACFSCRAGGLLRRPEHPAALDLLRLGHVEVLGHVAQRGVEDAALAVHPLPAHRHGRAVDPGGGLDAGEGRGGQHLVARVHVHVVLLGLHGEVLQAFDDRVVVLRDVDRVVDDAVGVGDPLAADHELVVAVIAEGVAHAAVPASDADAARDGRQQAAALLLGDLAHGPAGHDQAEAVHEGLVEVGVEGGGHRDLEAFLLEEIAHDLGRFLGGVAVPAAADDQRTFHIAVPYLSLVLGIAVVLYVYSAVRFAVVVTRPAFRPSGPAAAGLGRSTVLLICTCSPALPASSNAHITSSTW